MIALPLLSNRSFVCFNDPRYARIAAVLNGGNDDPARIEVEPNRRVSGLRAGRLRLGFSDRSFGSSVT